MAKVLLVDDESSIRRTLKDILSFEKYEVVEAVDGLDGIEKVKQQSFDVILLDIKMPRMDGIEAFEKNKSSGTRDSSDHDIRSRQYRYCCRCCQKRCF